ncbi:isthmin-2 [Esox lucius]|uniref:AMOP domain-containing protein n=1 Tax=Esox lucius TaxID=8010 RepID=A0AAY5KT90_ESOLU|nr:isthmin-2 [Esox lucius]
MQMMRSNVQLLWVLVLTMNLVSVKSFPTFSQKSLVHKGRSTATTEAIFSAKLGADEGENLEDIQQQNHLQSLAASTPSSQRLRHRGWFQGVLPKPEPDEDPEPFILDLRNFPELANADLGSHNPNIQVTIEVIKDPQTEMEMDLAKEGGEGGRNDWSLSSEEWLGNKKLFWPLFWDYPDQTESDSGPSGRASLEEQEQPTDDYNYDLEDSVLSGTGGIGTGVRPGAGVGDGWGNRWASNKGWDSKENNEYEEEEWSEWSPCSVTCGHGNQKRHRSCGYACTATESRTCDIHRCPDDLLSVTDLMPLETMNATDPLATNVDSCEKWLNCKNDFLQKYLHQVLTELPSCPCTYPSEAVYSAVNIFDKTLRKTYRWRDASGPKERLDIYKPSARFCARSMLSVESTTLAAQHCCYDDHMKLITRGKGAGAPNLISTEFSPELHHKVDVLPWILCNGDWSRFHSVRPPNNGLQCSENPLEEVYQVELEEAREY